MDGWRLLLYYCTKAGNWCHWNRADEDVVLRVNVPFFQRAIRFGMASPCKLCVVHHIQLGPEL